MEKVTRTRGSRDTPPLRYVIALLASILLHFVPVPVYLFGGMIGWFGEPPPELPDHETIIPVDLMLTEAPEEPGGPETPTPEQPPVSTLEEPPTASPSTEPVTLDGGLDERPDAALDAGTDAALDSDVADGAVEDGRGDASEQGDGDISVRDAGLVSADAGKTDAALPPDAAIAKAKVRDVMPASRPDAAVASTDAGVGGGGDGGSDVRPHRPIRDPVGLAGDAKSITPRNPNVSLMIYLDRIRQHPLGQRYGATLTKLKNWQNFFGGTGLDPVQDIDRILLAGPQLRDSSRVVAVIRYNVPPPRVRAALDALVKRKGSRGEWVPKRVPVARAHVDGAQRYFVMIAPHMLVVVPPDGLEQALKLPPNLHFPAAGNEAVVLFLKYPANAFRDQPVKLPSTVDWMRFSMELKPSGGADARLDAKDKDVATAAQNAPRLTELVNKLTMIDYFFGKTRFLDPVTFRAEKDHIRAETHVTDAQLGRIVALLTSKIEQVDGQGRAPPVLPR